MKNFLHKISEALVGALQASIAFVVGVLSTAFVALLAGFWFGVFFSIAASAFNIGYELVKW